MKVQKYHWEIDENFGNNNVLIPSTRDNDPVDIIVYYSEKNDHFEHTELHHNIKNGENYKDIYENFIGNDIKSEANALHNEGTINNVSGNFIRNHTIVDSGSITSGGVILNTNGGYIKNLAGNFIGNIISSPGQSQGGAIRNGDGNAKYARIDEIQGMFMSNYARTVDDNESYGGAIFNQNGSIGIIKADFINNQVFSKQFVQGGAIFNGNGGQIEEIKGDFIGNNASGGQVKGGAIYDIAGINLISGKFINNYVDSLYPDVEDGYGNFPDANGQGGAIYICSEENNTTINSDFIGNYAKSDYHKGQGGAIYASTSNKKLAVNGNFYNNYVIGTDGAMGGAVYVNSKAEISLKNNNFYGNYAITKSGNAQGGALYYSGANELTNASFIGNFAESEKGDAQGGAVWSNKNLTINADNGKSIFSGNYVKSGSTETNEAVYIDGAQLVLNAVNGGEILFDDEINGNNYTIKIQGDLDSSVRLNDIIKNSNDTILTGTILKLGSNDIFADSKLTVLSGILDVAGDTEYTEYNIKTLKSEAQAKYNIDVAVIDGKEYNDSFNVSNDSSGTITLSQFVVNAFETIKDTMQNEEEYVFQIIKNGNDNIRLAFEDGIHRIDEATSEMNSDMILAEDFSICTTDTTDDSVRVVGWRDSLAAWAELETDDKKIFTINDGDTQFLTRNLDDEIGLQGKDITIVGESSATLNVNNKNLLSNIGEEQTVTLSNLSLENSSNIKNDGILKLDNLTMQDSLTITNNKELSVSGKTNINNTITSSEKGIMNITDAETNITGVVENQNITSTNSTINLVNIEDFQNNSLAINSGEVNLFDLGLNNLHLNNFELVGGDINIDRVDVDLANKLMGRISADSYDSEFEFTGNINVKDMNLVSDAKTGITAILFADEAIKDKVVSEIFEVPTNGQNYEVYSPIYKYTVDYSNDGTYGNGGYFVFKKQSGEYNPAVLSSGTAAQTGAYTAMTEAFGYAFEHANTFSALPSDVRTAALNENKYAINESISEYEHPHQMNIKGMWVRPYVTFENIPLKNGPEVDTITYGTLVGGDSELFHLKNGWHTLTTGYIGYNGSSQHYQGSDITQNGALLGLTQTFYKNNFYTAFTASAGASLGSANTMYGNEEFSMLMTGAALKTGYSYEFKDGKFIIQPSMLLSYTFVNTFDYTNAAGVRINSDPLHAISLRPNVKMVMNTESNWQPYISAGVVYNILDETSVMANDVKLPNMSIKPYAEYGLGIQKKIGDDFTGFAQTMVRNGGRNGIAFTFGLRWALCGEYGNHVAKKEKHKIAKIKLPKFVKNVKVPKFIEKASNYIAGADMK